MGLPLIRKIAYVYVYFIRNITYYQVVKGIAGKNYRRKAKGTVFNIILLQSAGLGRRLDQTNGDKIIPA